jgi:hypothetical protein
VTEINVDGVTLISGGLGTDLIHQIERRLGRAPEPGEAGVGDDLPDGGIARLRAERSSASST